MKTLSLAEKTSLLILLDAWQGGYEPDDARELLVDLGIVTSAHDVVELPLKPQNPLFALVWCLVFGGWHPGLLKSLLTRYGFLRTRGGETRLTTLARALRADEVAGRL